MIQEYLPFPADHCRNRIRRIGAARQRVAWKNRRRTPAKDIRLRVRDEFRKAKDNRALV